MNIKLSIITVTYNSARTISCCLESIINQKLPGVEYLVIDGGSTDGTLDIVSKFQSGIDSLISEKDRGIYHAMNKGWRLAQGEYVLFINSDDELVSGGLKILLEEIVQSNGTDMLLSPVNACIQGKSRVLRPKIRKDRFVYYTMPVCHQGLVVKRELMRTLEGFDESYRILADFDFLLRALKAGVSFHELNHPIANYDLGGAGSGIKHLHEYSRLYIGHGFPRITSCLYVFRIWLSYHLQSILPFKVVKTIKAIKRSPYPAKTSQK